MDLHQADYAKAIVGLGLPDGLAQAVAGWDVAASQGALFDGGQQMSKLIGRKTTTLAAVVAEAFK